eukprot:bmy_05120T0
MFPVAETWEKENDAQPRSLPWFITTSPGWGRAISIGQKMTSRNLEKKTGDLSLEITTTNYKIGLNAL